MRQLSNERGLTLAELLAVFVIGSIVLILVTSILIFVQKQFQEQTTDARHLTDITIAMKAITKDARFYDIELEATEDGEIIFTEGPTYRFDTENGILQKNEADFVYEISTFSVKKEADGLINILIESETGQKLETTLSTR